MTDITDKLAEEALYCSRLLSAMAHNYANGHNWDHLDGEACTMASTVLREIATYRQHTEAQAGGTEGQTLWLWQNGDHFLAFEHLYPCYSPGGDPMTLGEPFGRAVFRKSFNRSGK